MEPRARMAYPVPMRWIGWCLAVSVLCSAPVAQAEEAGRGLMQRGLELFLEGLQDEIGPTLDELEGLGESLGPAMRGFLEEMGPAMAGIFAEVSDWTLYHPPEILPNGDIILRRRTDPPEPDPPERENEEADEPIDI